MKKIILGIFLVLFSIVSFTQVKADEPEMERKYLALPEITAGTFTNFAWGATQEVGVSTEFSKDGKNSFKNAKTSVTGEGSGASIYYQKLGEKIAALGVSDYVGVKLTVYNTTAISGGLAFFYGGEVYDVEAYADDSTTNLATRNLDYVGYRTYIVPFGTVNPTTIGEMQINIWGNDATTIYVSQVEVVYMGEVEEEIETPVVERKYDALPEITAATFSNYCWGSTQEVGVSTDYSKDGKNSFKNAKVSVTGQGSGASIYYLSLGNKIKNLYLTECYGIKLTVYSTAAISGGLAFKYNGGEIYDVEAYADGSTTDLATRNLDYAGYRTYIVPFGTIDPTTIGEMEISIWGDVPATIYVSEFEVVYTGEKTYVDPRLKTSLSPIVAGSFTNFGWNCDMTISVVTDNSADENSALKVVKGTVHNTSDNSANVYYQGLGRQIKALGHGSYDGVAVTIYNETSINGGLLFKYGATEIYDVEAYSNGSTNLATRNLDYVGYRTYIIPAANIDLLSTNEFQIGIWGSEQATIYISNIQLVHNEALVPHAESEAVRENEQASTCKVAGSYDLVVYCSTGREELSRQTIALPLEDHEWGTGVITTEPKHGVVGVRTYTCTCGDTKTEEVPALEHSHSTEWTNDETHHWHECACGDQADKVEHVWGEGEVTTEPEHGVAGVRTYTCLCGATKTETEPALEHSHSTEWSKDETHHWHECTCGDKKDKAEHSGGTATETEKAKCSVCGQEYGELKEPAKEPQQTKGCAGSVIVSLLGVLTLAGSAIVLRKKREE